MIEEKSKTSDTELVLQVTGFNSTAFEQIYNRYSATIYTLIKEIVSGRKLSEKILLNVFAIFLKRIEYYDISSDSLFTWLISLARNKSIDTLKRAKFADDIPTYSDQYEIEYMLPKLSREINSIQLNESKEKIKSYKNHLTEVQNLVLSLVYFEGLQEEEIAKRLNVPVVTIKQKIQTTMGILMQFYSGKNLESSSNKQITDMIKLDVLSCLNESEKKYFEKLKEDDPNFLWKELGEYQNLAALISSSIIPEAPAPELIVEISKVFNNIVRGNEVDYIQTLQSPEIAPQPVAVSKSSSGIARDKENPDLLNTKVPDLKQPTTLKKPEPAVSVKVTKEPFVSEIKTVQGKITKTESEIINIPVQPKEAVLVDSDVVSRIVSDQKLQLHKVFTAGIENINAKAKVDETPIFTADTKPLMVKEEAAVQSKTTSTSTAPSEFKMKFKDPQSMEKEVKPIVERYDNTIQIKAAVAIAKPSEFKIKIKDVPIVEREIKPINLKVNSPIQNRILTPNSEHLELRNKINNVPPPKKEVKQETPVQNRVLIPNSEHLEFRIKIKDVPIQKKEITPVPANISNPIQNRVLIPNSEKQDYKVKAKDEPAPEKEIKPIAAKEVIAIPEVKVVKPVSEKVNPINLNEWQKVEKENKQVIKRADRPVQSEEIKQVEVKEKVESEVKVSEVINIDDIISMIEDKEEQIVSVDDKNLIENEKTEQPKRSKIKWLAAASVILVLASAGTFFYMNMQSSSADIVGKKTKSDKIVLAAQNNSATQSDTQTQTINILETQPIVESLPIEEEKPTVEKVITLSSPKTSTSEDNAYLSLNDNGNQVNNKTQVTNQTTGAKTETLVPPKENKKVEEEPAFFVAVEEMPQLIGGIKGLQGKIVYPEIARRVGVEGKVIVQAIVDESGNVISVKTVKGIGSGCDEVAMDAIRNSKFTPGKQRGKTVKTQVTIPIVFTK